MSKHPVEFASNNPYGQQSPRPDSFSMPNPAVASGSEYPQGTAPQFHFAPPAGPPPGMDVLPPAYQPRTSFSNYPSEPLSAPAAYASRPGVQPTQQDASLPSASTSERSFLSGLKDKIAPRDPLNPPPPSFARQPDPRFPYGPFAYMSMVSIGSHLDDGFPLVAPGAGPGAPHPFATHDVQQADWIR
jgi:hypothetical protein